MKSTAVIATLASVSTAVSTETVSALMQYASFGNPYERERFGGDNPFGQNSNFNDRDLKRQKPDFANPNRKGDEREKDVEPFLEGEELIPIAVRNAQAAIRDPILAKEPELRPLFNGSYDLEPLDYSNKKFLSPVFLVDPMFTMGMEGEKNQLF
jgi:hypothetical protein